MLIKIFSRLWSSNVYAFVHTKQHQKHLFKSCLKHLQQCGLCWWWCHRPASLQLKSSDHWVNFFPSHVHLTSGCLSFLWHVKISCFCLLVQFRLLDQLLASGPGLFAGLAVIEDLSRKESATDWKGKIWTEAHGNALCRCIVSLSLEHRVTWVHNAQVGGL